MKIHVFAKEIEEIKNDHNLVHEGIVDSDEETLVAMTKDEIFIIPLSVFEPSGDGTTPDFKDFSIDDHGQTVRFGNYECDVEWIFCHKQTVRKNK